MVIIYRGFTFRKGTRYTIEGADHGLIEVSRHFLFFRPVRWCFDGNDYQLKLPSNTSSSLYNASNSKIAEIYEGGWTWHLEFEGLEYKMNVHKRGYSLEASGQFLATFTSDARGRFTCTYPNATATPTAFLVYILVHLRVSLDSGG